MAIKVGINGFGRIGRMAFRAIKKDFPELEVVGINDLLENDYLAYMLKYDTAQGRFDGEVAVEGDNFIIDGKKVRLSAERNPADLKWDEVGAEIVIDCTGFFLTEESCQATLMLALRKLFNQHLLKTVHLCLYTVLTTLSTLVKQSFLLHHVQLTVLHQLRKLSMITGA